MSEHPAILARGIRKSYAGAGGPVTVLKDLELSVKQGEIVVIRGRSGAGKTTLLHILGLMDDPDAGELRIAGEDARSLDRHRTTDLVKRIGFMFQSLQLLPRLTALENAAIGLVPYDVAPGERTERAAGLLYRIGLSGKLHRKPSELSLGERSRVALARALIWGPAIVLADEPVSAVDPETGRDMLRLLAEHVLGNNAALIVVSHHPLSGLPPHRTLELHAGRLHDGDRGGDTGPLQDGKTRRHVLIGPVYRLPERRGSRCRVPENQA